jgi:hypothetical protein
MQFTTKIGGKTCLGPSYLRLGKMKEGMKLSLPPKLVENPVWVPVTHLMPYYAPKMFWHNLQMPKLASLTPSSPDFANIFNIESKCRDDFIMN